MILLFADLAYPGASASPLGLVAGLLLALAAIVAGIRGAKKRRSKTVNKEIP